MIGVVGCLSKGIAASSSRLDVNVLSSEIPVYLHGRMSYLVPGMYMRSQT